MKLKPQTRICKICFNEIKNENIADLILNNVFLCEKCRKSLEPKFIRFMVNDTQALSIYNYDDKIRELLYQFKGCYDIELKDVFLSDFIDYLKIKYYGYVAIPAPSYILHDEKRSFNHVDELINVIGLPKLKAFTKIKDIKQANSNKRERSNVKNIIKMSDKINVKGMNVLLVDDVFTTGATMRTMLNLIKTKEPKTIKILVLSKTENL